MNAPDIGKADFSALLELAESRFNAWHLKELRPERDRRIGELRRQNLTSGGRAVHAMRIYRELLEREVRQRIGSYAAVAHESGNSEMLSRRRLDEYRDRIMTSVGAGTGALKGHIERDVRAAGDFPESALPSESRYVQLQTEILNIVNAELRVLEAEGDLAGRAVTNADVGADVGPADHGDGADRRAAVDAFFLPCKQETSLTPTRTYIWRAAGHRTPRQFQFWQAADPKATVQDDRTFRRILAMSPRDFETLLRARGII